MNTCPYCGALVDASAERDVFVCEFCEITVSSRDPVAQPPRVILRALRKRLRRLQDALARQESVPKTRVHSYPLLVKLSDVDVAVLAAIILVLGGLLARPSAAFAGLIILSTIVMIVLHRYSRTGVQSSQKDPQDCPHPDIESQRLRREIEDVTQRIQRFKDVSS